MVAAPETKYAQSGDVSIAYQVVGEGEHDIVLVPGGVTYTRMSASPGGVAALWRMNLEIDIRHVLPAVRVPMLVIHRAGDVIPVEGARYLETRIPGSDRSLHRHRRLHRTGRRVGRSGVARRRRRPSRARPRPARAPPGARGRYCR